MIHTCAISYGMYPKVCMLGNRKYHSLVPLLFLTDDGMSKYLKPKGVADFDLRNSYGTTI